MDKSPSSRVLPPDEILFTTTGAEVVTSYDYMYCDCLQGFLSLFCEYEYTVCGNWRHVCFHGSVCHWPDGGGGYTCLCNIDTALGECVACLLFVCTDETACLCVDNNSTNIMRNSFFLFLARLPR